MQQRRLIIVIFLCTTSTILIGQDNDCATTNMVACNNITMSLNPSGTGVDDFYSLENDSGCLNREYSSTWIIISFNNLMPPASQLEFTISPSPLADFDFAVYGPDYDCSSLGAPIICSYADGNTDTGAGNGATDYSEGATGDGFVTPIIVNPNETYILLIDDFANDGGSIDLSWGGSAAPYIQCCPLTANAGPDLMVCEGDPAFMLNGSAFANNGDVTYSWSATNGGISFLDDPNSPTPMVVVPPGVTGTFVYTLTVTDSECLASSSMELHINANPTTSILASDPAICPGSDITLTVDGVFSTYMWNTGEESSSILVSAAGTYDVVVTDANGCSASSSITISTLPAPIVEITGNSIICTAASTTFDAGLGYTSYLWSTGQSSQEITVQSAGVYSVTVTDDNGCEGVASIEASLQDDMTPMITGNLSFCPDQSTTLSVDQIYTSYEWSTGESTQQITVSTAGSYVVTVSDGNCEAEVDVSVTENQPPAAVITGNFDFCEGTTTQLAANAGFEYEWSTGEEIQSIIVASPGVYEVTVTDANGCSDSAQVITLENPNPIPIITGSTSICTDSSTTLDAGSGYIDYQWSDGQNGQSAIVSYPGLVNVMVTDINGCTGTSSVNISQIMSPAIDISGPTNICSDQTATLIADAGFTNYAWSNSDEGQSIAVVDTGSYSVTATDTFGCKVEASFTLNAFPSPILSISGELNFCSGDSTTLDAGEFHTSYQWSNGNSTQTINVNEAGNYSVTVTNNEGCISEEMISVEEHDLPVVNINGEPAICEGSLITLNVEDEFTNYLWSDGSNSPSIVVGSEGIYSVNVTDANGCEANDQFVLHLNPNPNPEIYGDHSFCPGSSTVLEGAPGFTHYIWNNEIDNQILEVTIAGTYELVVIDSNGCFGSVSLEINESPEINPSIEGDLSFCPGTTTILDAGTSFDTYTWSDNSNGQTLMVNQAADYSVTVTKGDCSGEATVTVLEHSLPQPEIIGDSVFCEGTIANLSVQDVFVDYNWSSGSTSPNTAVNTDGWFSVFVTDGNGCENTDSIEIKELNNPSPMIVGELGFCPNGSTTLRTTENYSSYSWSNSATSDSIIVDFSGTISIAVMDENGCLGGTEVMIAEYQTTDPQINGLSDFCPGDTSTLSVVGDFESYQWLNSDIQEASMEVSEAGTYEVIVSDENGCETTTSFSTNIFPILIPQIIGNSEYCEGTSTILTASDGYSTYLWSDEINTQSLEVSTPGIYTLSVTDANGCLAATSIDIIEHPLPEVNIIGATAFCTGGSTMLDAGDDFESYQWSNNSTTQTVEINTPGQISVLVTDLNGCQNTATLDVQENVELSISIQGDLEICSGDSTTISPTVPFATYQWSNHTNESYLTTDQAGSYSVTVTDINGCLGTTSVEISIYDLPNPQIMGDTSFCEGETTSLSLNETYEAYSWSTGESGSIIEISTAGIYSVDVVDSNGCAATMSTHIEVFSSPIIEILGSEEYCAGESTTLSVNDTFATYHWSNGDTIANTIINQAGLYEIWVSTDQACASSASIQIHEIPLPEAFPGNPQIIDCINTSATLGAVNLPEGAFTYNWSGPGINLSNQNEIQPIISQGGVYTLIIENLENGCISEPVSVEIEDVRYEPLVALMVLDVLDCNTHSVLVNSEGSTSGPHINYLWHDSNGHVMSSDQHYSATEPGMLSLRIMDEETGCEASNSINVDQNIDFPIAIAGDDQELNCFRPQANLIGSASSSHSNILYEWSVNIDGNIISENNSPNITVDSEGVYTLLVTDTTNGCTDTDVVEVFSNFEYPVADAGMNQTLDCNTSSVILDARNSSLGNHISYKWKNEQHEILSEMIDLEVDKIGKYHLLVTNNHSGCATEDHVEVLQTEEELSIFDIEWKKPTCLGDDDASISIDNIQGGVAPFLFAINDGPFSTESNFNGLSAGFYSVTVQDANGCELSSELIVEEGNYLQVNLGEDLNIKLGETVTLNGNVTVNKEELEEISWEVTNDERTCDNCIVFDASPMRTSEYVLTVVDRNGCSAFDNIWIFVDARDHIYIPNAFSPNGDGNNERFTIFTGKDVAKVRSFMVFNRWGEVMFERKNFQPNDEHFGWNGEYKGQLQNTGVFIYTAEIEFIDGTAKVFKGDVFLKK